MGEPVEVHEFDFWLGRWEVFTPDGALAGTNHITALFGGRVLAESWTGRTGVLGVSLNSWDPEQGSWHQTWMDSGGSTLLLDGGLHDGRMVLEGRVPSPAAVIAATGTTPTEQRVDAPSATQRHRITWTPSADGDQVRQFWESSDDDGATWAVVFDGRYRRVAE